MMSLLHPLKSLIDQGEGRLQLWGLLFDRLQNSRTPKFVRSFIVFLALFICKHGVVFVASSVDAVQAGLFVGGILQQVWLPHFATISGKNETKLIAISTIKVAPLSE
jgi:exportin-2 (importin alpha re-exporter)